MKRSTHVTIRIRGETWSVPRGFGRAYRFAVAAQLALFHMGKPAAIVSSVVDLLALIGYSATREQVMDWDLRRRVEASVYAASEHSRASDNHGPKHPRPEWLPARPWQGPELADGIRHGTAIVK